MNAQSETNEALPLTHADTLHPTPPGPKYTHRIYCLYWQSTQTRVKVVVNQLGLRLLFFLSTHGVEEAAQ